MNKSLPSVSDLNFCIPTESRNENRDRRKILRMEIFSSFLTNLLKEKKIDVSVYHSYLMGILEDSLDEDEKRETVSDIIGSLIVSCMHGNSKKITE